MYHMASLLQMAKGLKQRRLDAARRRQRSARQLQNALLVQKRSSSGLDSVERKIESTKEELTDVSGVLGLKLAQKESLERLISNAKERLMHEHQAKEQTVQEFEFAQSEEEKQNAVSRLRTITERIEELGYEITERSIMLKKITNSINNVESEKSKISTRLQRQSKTKPVLKERFKNSLKESKEFKKQLNSSTRQAEIAANKLEKLKEKLSKVSKNKRKSSTKKAKRKASKAKPKVAKKAKRKASKAKPKVDKKAKRKASKAKRK